ncbi:MAG TPA: serine hydrolase, partial [Chloroflexota bacterium]|nr:serine hydrolase [Chloroflexota bacterium]
MKADDYFPPPESRGGWRTALASGEARERAGIDIARLEAAWDFASSLHDDSALLVVRHGWLCFERYQGVLSATYNRDMHSCGKAFTSTACGVLLGERPDLFPKGLDQPVYNGDYLPPPHMPLHDERKRSILLRQLLSHTAGLRGNNGNTFTMEGPVEIDPPGPDGSFPDAVAFGHQTWPNRDLTTSAETLWCDPGAGFSYASAGPLIVGAMIRHLTGQEVADYLAKRVFAPIGWEHWQWDQNPPESDGSRHTKAQGGIKPRPRDALRFGYLHLRSGDWDGLQLVPTWYAQAMPGPSPPNPYPVAYGLQVRINPRGAAAASPPDAY